MPIFDQGYQHWSGELSGHAWRWLAIARHGVRIGMKNWLLRIAILLAWIPAIGLAFMLCVWGLLEQKSPLASAATFLFEFLPAEVLQDPKAYRVEFWTIAYETFMLCELRYSMILVMLVGPSLISQDLRFNALPLYFSRPLRRIDYFLGKLGVVGWFLAMGMIFPSLIAYVLGLLFSLDLSIIPDTLPVLFGSIGYGLLVSVVSGLVILALSSLTRNSRYIALAWLAVVLIGSITGLVLEQVQAAQRREETYRLVQDERRVQANTPPTRNPQEQARQFKEQQERQKKMWADVQQHELEEASHNWGPMVSYMANLARVGQRFLSTDAAWRRIGAAVPAEQRGRFLLGYMGPQHPWYWSAIVLLILVGISACVLNFRVKSLDRLK